MNLRKLMDGYLTEVESTKSFNPLSRILPESFVTASQDSLPVNVEKTLWRVELGPERLVRLFEFPSIDLRNWFVSELLEHEGQTGHYGSLTVEGLSILVEVHTHDIDKVTELDKEYASFCDAVYDDVQMIDLEGMLP